MQTSACRCRSCGSCGTATTSSARARSPRKAPSPSSTTLGCACLGVRSGCSLEGVEASLGSSSREVLAEKGGQTNTEWVSPQKMAEPAQSPGVQVGFPQLSADVALSARSNTDTCELEQRNIQPSQSKSEASRRSMCSWTQFMSISKRSLTYSFEPLGASDHQTFRVKHFRLAYALKLLAYFRPETGTFPTAGGRRTPSCRTGQAWSNTADFRESLFMSLGEEAWVSHMGAFYGRNCVLV